MNDPALDELTFADLIAHVGHRLGCATDLKEHSPFGDATLECRDCREVVRRAPNIGWCGTGIDRPTEFDVWCRHVGHQLDCAAARGQTFVTLRCRTCPETLVGRFLERAPANRPSPAH